MFAYIEKILLSFSEVVPLEIFVPVGSVVEEVIAPIPSPFVMLVAGSISSVEGRMFGGFILLVVLGAIGKTLGALVVYTIADKAEDVVLGKYGRYFGITHEEVMGFRHRVGTGLRAYLMLTFLRALPIIPSALLSIGAGVTKLSRKLFVVATFVGTLFRDAFYLYAGYVGTRSIEAIVHNSANAETYIEIAVFLAVVCYIVYRTWGKARKES